MTGDWSGSSGSASIITEELIETIKPTPTVQLPGVSIPVAAIPPVEMPVKNSNVVTPATSGGYATNQNPFVTGGGVMIAGTR